MYKTLGNLDIPAHHLFLLTASENNQSPLTYKGRFLSLSLAQHIEAKGVNCPFV